ncbi:MAG: EamA family transporter [Leptolyngbyaceae cyanobacterium SL_1_1]|nr:EamA family transporter [Leptolyngbyaceae cyanobacterium RM1_1_2]NJO09913.1 EamA family transporter [Leptolyngbyaceae cyanobacterium SL_1_1]
MLLASCTAFFEASKDIFSKRSLNQLNLYLVAWAWPVLTTLCLLPAIAWAGLPPILPGFWAALLAGGLLNTLAFLLYIKAISTSDISLTVPYVSFTPLFLGLTSPFIVQESADLGDVVGGLLIVLGAYVLNWRSQYRSPLAPFQAFWQEPGPKLMLGVALIWSITANIDKVGVQTSSPLLWLVALHSFISLGMLPVVWRQVPAPIQQLQHNLKLLLPIGLAQMIATTCQMNALELTVVADVISVKRTSTLIAALMGHLFFQEPGLRQRLLGASIMLSGVFLILRT